MPMIPVSLPSPGRLAALLVLTLIVSPLAATAAVIPFDTDAWVLYNAEVVEHDGRQCLIGSAFLPNIAFANGVIEYDVMVDGRRGYPGVRFRATSQYAYESFYVRPHVPDRPDAIQYTAAFAGVSGWQLYNGPGYTAAAPIPTGEWIHIRLEILGRRGRVFMGDDPEPVLVMNDLKHEVGPGSIAINSQRDTSAYFSNFSVTATDELDLGPEPNPIHPRGLVEQWELSQTFRATDVDLEVYPGADRTETLQWQTAVAEPGGLLDFCRHVPRSINGEADVVYARTFLTAEAPEIREFTFGYSDYVSVFLNGRLLFTGNSAYRSRDETFSGVVGLYDMLHLPLETGRNELLFAVMESFGGWGLIGQDNSDDFLHATVTELWRQSTGNRLPESVLYDPERDQLYVTQYFRGGNEYISRLGLDGEVLQQEWVTGLQRPTGLILHGGRLWAVDRRNLCEIDIEAGEVVRRHVIPDAAFPNDVAFDGDGRAYITDTRGNRIHRFTDGGFEVWLEGVEVDQPNGLLIDGDRLLFGNQGDGCLKAVDLADRTVTRVACFGDDANIDGIRRAGPDAFIASDFGGRIFHVRRSGEVTGLLDTTASGYHCADLEYIPEHALLIVPGLYDNRLAAYRFTGLE